MDNRVFNVNGIGKETLRDTLRLVLRQEWNKDNTCEGWRVSKTHGLIILWHVENQEHGTKFITPLGYEPLTDLVWEWLESDEANEIELVKWDADYQHDGSNSYGWRVYCEDWNKVDNDVYAIFTITPSYMWHGK